MSIKDYLDNIKTLLVNVHDAEVKAEILLFRHITTEHVSSFIVPNSQAIGVIPVQMIGVGVVRTVLELLCNWRRSCFRRGIATKLPQ